MENFDFELVEEVISHPSKDALQDIIRKAADAGYPTFKFFNDNENGIKAIDTGSTDDLRLEFIASSDVTDLVGDVMSNKALQKMNDAAIGKTFFLNHSYKCPEDIFGQIVASKVVKQQVDDPQFGSGEMLALIYEVKVNTANPRSIETYNAITKNGVKLGASISILVTDKETLKDGRRIIKDLIFLECSVVGIPCNWSSWVVRANKALNADKKSIPALAEEIPVIKESKKEKLMKSSSETVSKGFYAQEFNEQTTDPYFLIYCFYNGYYDLCRAVGSGALSAENISQALSDGFDEFKAIASPALESNLAARAKAGDDDAWYSYALAMDSAVVKNLVAMHAVTQKSGKTISEATMKKLQDIHKCLKSMGVDCSKDADEGMDESVKSENGEADAEKDASISTLESTVKNLEEVKAAQEASALAKDSEIESLKKELVEVKRLKDEWETSARVTMEALKQFESEPLFN